MSYVVHVVRRSFGIPHDVFVTRCDLCKWRVEARELHTATVLRRNHECQEARP